MSTINETRSTTVEHRRNPGVSSWHAYHERAVLGKETTRITTPQRAQHTEKVAERSVKTEEIME